MNRIAELRKKQGLSQAELAEQLGIAQNTLSQYENERRIPTGWIIESLADLFGVSLNTVLGIAAPAEQAKPSYELTNATRIVQSDSVLNVNRYLAMGWRLIHVGQYSRINNDSEVYADVYYTLAWFGDPKGVIDFEGEDTEDPYFKY